MARFCSGADGRTNASGTTIQPTRQPSCRNTSTTRVPARTAAELSPPRSSSTRFEVFLHDRLAGRLDVVPEALVRPVERLQQNLAISVPTLSQIAAEAAFEGREEWKTSNMAIRKTAYSDRGLPKAGLNKFLAADGAFYLYADVSEFTSDSLEFAKQMLEKAMSRPPGVDFDRFTAIGFYSLFLCASAEEMREAGRVSSRWLDRNMRISGLRQKAVSNAMTSDRKLILAVSDAPGAWGGLRDLLE